MPSKAHIKRVQNKGFYVAGVIAIGALGMLATVYANQLQTRVVGRSAASFTITGPSVLVPRQSATITWTTSAENAAKYPYEKIEYCTRTFFGECTVLATSVPNSDRQATVTVPASLQTGQGYLKLIARTSNKLLAWGTRAYAMVGVVNDLPNVPARVV